MICYNRVALPSPLRALAWRDASDPGTDRSRLTVIVGLDLSAKDARAAALSAVRRLPRRQQPRLLGLAVPGVLWFVGTRVVTAAAVVAGTGATTATVAASVGVIGVTSVVHGHIPLPPAATVIGVSTPAGALQAQRRPSRPQRLSAPVALANGVSVAGVALPVEASPTLIPALPEPRPPETPAPPPVVVLPPPAPTEEPSAEPAPPETPAPTTEPPLVSDAPAIPPLPTEEQTEAPAEPTLLPPEEVPPADVAGP